MIKNFRQLIEINYFEIYSEVIKIVIWQFIFVFIIKYNYEIHHCDIVTVFFKFELNEQIYVKQFIVFEKTNELI